MAKASAVVSGKTTLEKNTKKGNIEYTKEAKIADLRLFSFKSR
jgi:hypothetical protein